MPVAKQKVQEDSYVSPLVNVGDTPAKVEVQEESVVQR